MDDIEANPGIAPPALPWGLLAAALLVLGVESGVARHDAFTTLPAAEHRFARDAAREARRYDVLCFGDSQAKDGLIPRVVAARLGKRTLNLAVAGSPAPTPFFLLQRALDSGARPAAILVNYHAWLMSVDPRDRVAMYAELCSLRECLELAGTARDARFLGALATSLLLPSFRARQAIDADLRAALQGHRGLATDPLRQLVIPSRRNWLANSSAQVMPRNPEAATTPAFWDESTSYLGNWSCVATNRIYLRRFLRLASEHRIPVFLLIPPRHPRVQANRERLGLDARYTRFLRAMTADDPNVTVVDARHSGYDAALFIDSSHLDRQGACDFSHDVAAVVAARLASGNPDRSTWVPLARQGRCPEPATLEDLTQSRLALTKEPTGARR